MIEFNGEEWLDTDEAAEYLLVTPKTLERMRKREGTPPFTKYNGRVYYNRQELFEWMAEELERNRVKP